MLKDIPKVLETIRANEEEQKTIREKLNIKANPEMPSNEVILQMIEKAERKAEFSEKEIRTESHYFTLKPLWEYGELWKLRLKICSSEYL